MISALLATLSLQLVFNLFVLGAPSVDDTHFVGGETTTEPPPLTLPAGYVGFPDVHAAYKLHEEETKWEVARERCIAEGGHLAVTDSVEKVQHINSLKSDSNDWIYVGIHRLTDHSEWVRVDDGLSPSSIPWINDQPGAYGNCASISYNGAGLSNYPCDWFTAWYVCEIPI